MSDQNLLQKHVRYQKQLTDNIQSANSSINEKDKKLDKSPEKRLQSAKMPIRKGSAVTRDFRNPGVKGWVEDHRQSNIPQQIVFKQPRKQSRNKYRHQTQLIDKIDKNIDLKMKQKKSRDTDIVNLADQQVNSFLMNNQKSEHRRLMSANSNLRSRSAALIPKHGREKTLNQKLFELNQAEQLLINPIYDDSQYKFNMTQQNSKKMKVPRQRNMDNEVKLSQIYSHHNYEESLAHSSSNKLSNTMQIQKQNKAYMKSSSRQYLSSSQHQADVLSLGDKSGQFAINLVDIQPQNRNQSRPKQVSKNSRIKRGVTPADIVAQQSNVTSTNHFHRRNQTQPGLIGQMKSANPNDIMSPLEMAASQTAYVPPFESQIDISQITAAQMGQKKNSREKNNNTAQSRYQGETTLDSDDLQMLMMLKTKLKKVRKKENQAKINHQKTPVSTFLNDFKIDLNQENQMRNIQQIDNEIEKLKNAKNLHLAQRSNSIAGTEIKSDENVIKKQRIHHSRAQTSLQNNKDLEESDKSKNGIRKTIEIQNSDQNFNNSEQIETKQTPQIKFIKTKKDKQKKYTFMENNESQKSQRTELKPANPVIIKKYLMNQDCQTDNEIQFSYSQPSKKEKDDQQALKEQLQSAQELRMQAENYQKMQQQHNIEVQEQLLKQLIKKEMQSMVQTQKTRARRLSVQSIDMQEIQVKSDIEKQKTFQDPVVEEQNSYVSEDMMQKDQEQYDQRVADYSSKFTNSMPSQGNTRIKTLKKPVLMPSQQSNSISQNSALLNRRIAQAQNKNLSSIGSKSSQQQQQAKTIQSSQERSRQNIMVVREYQNEMQSRPILNSKEYISDYTEEQDNQINMQPSVSSTPIHLENSPIREKRNIERPIYQQQPEQFEINYDDQQQYFENYGSNLNQEEQELGVYEDNSESSRYINQLKQESLQPDDYEQFDEASDMDYSYDSEEDESVPTTNTHTTYNMPQNQDGAKLVKKGFDHFIQLYKKLDQEVFSREPSPIDFDQISQNFEKNTIKPGYESIQITVNQNSDLIDLSSQFNKLVHEIETTGAKNLEMKDFDQKVDKLKLNRTLMDLERQNVRQQLNKRIKPLKLLEVPQKSLICIRDVNLQFVKDQNIMSKIEKNKDFVREDDQNESIKEKLRKGGYFRIDQHWKKHLGCLCMMDQDMFRLTENSLYLPKLKNFFKTQIKRRMNEQFLNQVCSYQYKGEVPSYFLKINNYQPFDQLNHNINLFDVMHDVSQYIKNNFQDMDVARIQAQYPDIYNQIDWHIVQDATERIQTSNYSQRVSMGDNYSVYQKNINTIINSYIQVPTYLYEQLKIELDNEMEEQLQSYVSHQIELEINFRHKLTFLAKKYFKWIQNYNFTTRYFHTVEYMNFREQDDKLRYRKLDPPQISIVLNQAKAATDQIGYILTSHGSQECINTYLFKMYFESIYTNMINQEWDIYAKQNIENVYYIYQKKDDRYMEMLQLKAQNGQGLKFNKPLRRQQSCPPIMSRIESINFKKQQIQLVQFDDMEMPLENCSVYCPRAGERERMIRPFRKYGAMTKYTRQQNEAIINKKMEPMGDRVKDHYFMAYKNLENFPVEWFQENHESGKLQQFFGYKCQFIRDINNPTYFMEVLMPVIAEKAEKKINRQKPDFIKLKYHLGTQVRKQFLRNNEVFDHITLRKMNPLDYKINEAAEAQDIQTDSSMEGVELGDIISDNSDQEQDEQKQNTAGYQKFMQCLEKTVHPFEHYNQMGNIRENAAKDPNSLISPQSKITDTMNSQVTVTNVKDIEVLDVQQLREWNEQNDNYRNKKDKFKIDSILNSNYAQIQNDFIKQLKTEKLKNQHYFELKNQCQERQGESKDPLLQDFLDYQYNKTRKLIHKLKFNLGLSSKMYFSDKEQGEVTMEGNESESDEFNLENMLEEERLIVEREIMMSILGKFIDDDFDESQLNDTISQSQESQDINNNTQKITESQLDDVDSNHAIIKSTVRKTENYQDKDSLQAPSSKRSEIIIKMQQDKEPDPEINDEYMDDEIKSISKLNKLHSFIKNNKFEDETPLESISSDGSDLKIDDKSQEPEIKRKKSRHEKRQRHGKAQRQIFVQEMLTKKMNQKTNNEKVDHVNDAFKQRNEILMNHLKIRQSQLPKDRKMEIFNKQIQIQQDIEYSVVRTVKSAINENQLLRRKLIRFVNSGRIKEMQKLIKKQQTMLNYQVIDDEGNSLVAIATCKGDLKMLKLLIRNQFDINIQNNDGNTALHFGIGLKQLKCTQQLLFANCNECLENNLGLTPWQCL